MTNLKSFACISISLRELEYDRSLRDSIALVTTSPTLRIALLTILRLLTPRISPPHIVAHFPLTLHTLSVPRANEYAPRPRLSAQDDVTCSRGDRKLECARPGISPGHLEAEEYFNPHIGTMPANVSYIAVFANVADEKSSLFDRSRIGKKKKLLKTTFNYKLTYRQTYTHRQTETDKDRLRQTD